MTQVSGGVSVPIKGDTTGVLKAVDDVVGGFDKLVRKADALEAALADETVTSKLNAEQLKRLREEADAARAKVDGLTEAKDKSREAAEKLDGTMGRLQTAVGGISSAFGGAAGPIGDMIGGVADAAMTFASDGPLMAGIAIVVGGLSALGSAWEESAEKARKAMEDSMKAVDDMIAKVKSANEELATTQKNNEVASFTKGLSDEQKKVVEGFLAIADAMKALRDFEAEYGLLAANPSSPLAGVQEMARDPSRTPRTVLSMNLGDAQAGAYADKLQELYRLLQERVKAETSAANSAVDVAKANEGAAKSTTSVATVLQKAADRLEEATDAVTTADVKALFAGRRDARSTLSAFNETVTPEQIDRELGINQPETIIVTHDMSPVVDDFSEALGPLIEVSEAEGAAARKAYAMMQGVGETLPGDAASALGVIAGGGSPGQLIGAFSSTLGAVNPALGALAGVVGVVVDKMPSMNRAMDQLTRGFDKAVNAIDRVTGKLVDRMTEGLDGLLDAWDRADAEARKLGYDDAFEASLTRILAAAGVGDPEDVAAREREAAEANERSRRENLREAVERQKQTKKDILIEEAKDRLRASIENNTSALGRVTEALVNIPSGYKIAAGVFAAAEPVAAAATAGGGGAFVAPMVINIENWNSRGSMDEDARALRYTARRGVPSASNRIWNGMGLASDDKG